MVNNNIFFYWCDNRYNQCYQISKKHAKIDFFMAANPMTQFEVYRIGPEIKLGTLDISFTNASLFMVISSLAILIIFNAS